METVDFGENLSDTTAVGGSFQYWTKLQALDLSKTKYETIRNGAFNNCGASTLVLPNTLTSLKDGAFQNMTNLQTLYIGSDCKLAKLEGGVFSCCAKLETVSLLDSNITQIKDSLKGNSNLKRIIFPKKLQSVTWTNRSSVDGCPFYSCSNVNELYFAQSDPSSLTFTDNVFQFLSASGTIYVPAGTSQTNIDAYKTKLTAAGLVFGDINWKIQEVVTVSALSVNPTQLRMTIGENKTLTAELQPENATYDKIAWISSDSTVASVSDTGVVTAKSAGVVTITAKSMIGDASATCTVTVLGAYSCATKIAASKTPQTLLLGGENVGEYLISGDSKTGFTLQKDGKYLALNGDRVRLQDKAFTWKYNGGLYADVPSGRPCMGGFFRIIRYARYYLAADANGQLYARLVYTKAMVLSSVITNVPPIRLTVEESVFRFMLFTRSSYVFTVENVPDGAKAEYSLGNTWTTGDTFSAASKPANVWIRVTEKDGTVTVWKATLTDGAYELNIVE